MAQEPLHAPVPGQFGLAAQARLHVADGVAVGRVAAQLAVIRYIQVEKAASPRNRRIDR